MKCQRCGEISEYDLDFFDYGKAKFLCFNCKACGHYSDSVDLSTIEPSESDMLPYIKGESLLEMLNHNDGDRRKALREVIRRRLDKLVVTVRSQNNYYLEQVKLRELLNERR